MAEPFLGEIKMVAFNFPPRNWAQCDGARLAINQHQTLYALLGTAFGGDGRSNFCLPDMRGRVPVSVGNGYNIGLMVGTEGVRLSKDQLPAHSHDVKVSNAPGDAVVGNDTRSFSNSSDETDPVYAEAVNLVPMHNKMVTPAEGGGQSHSNLQPFNVVNFVIALEGQYPPRN